MRNSWETQNWSQSALNSKYWKVKIPRWHNPLKQRKAAKDRSPIKWHRLDVNDPWVALGKGNRYAKLHQYAARSIWNESWWDIGAESKSKKSAVNFRGFGKEKFRVGNWY